MPVRPARTHRSLAAGCALHRRARRWASSRSARWRRRPARPDGDVVRAHRDRRRRQRHGRLPRRTASRKRGRAGAPRSSSSSTRRAAASTRRSGSPARSSRRRVPGHRLGRAQRRPGGERRHVHHPGGEPRLHGARARTSGPPRRSAATARTSPGTLGEKVKNDAIANITAIAEARGRPVDWAVSTVAEAKSLLGERGGRGGRGRRDRRDDRRGARARRTGGGHGRRRGRRTLDARRASASTRQADEPAPGRSSTCCRTRTSRSSCSRSAFYGLIFELQNPNFVTGILGALAIILAFIGFGSLPLNVAGLLLIVPRASCCSCSRRRSPATACWRSAAIICFVLGRVRPVHAARRSRPRRSSRSRLPVIVVTTATDRRLLMGLITRRRHPDPPHGAARSGRRRRRRSRWARRASSRRRSSRSAPVYLAGEEWTARTADTQPRARATRPSGSSASTA